MNKETISPLSRLLLWALLSLSSLATHASEKLTIAAFEYPPIYQDGDEKGLAGDLTEAAFRATGIEIELKFLSPARMVQTVARGETRCGIGGAVMFEAPEVAAHVKRGPAIHYVLQGFMYDTRKFPLGLGYTDLREMNRHTVGVLFASGIMHFLQGQQVRFNTSSTLAGSARQLKTGWIDAWAVDDLTGQLHMQKLFPDESSHFINSPPFNRGDVSLICSTRHDSDQAILRRFEQGLKMIQANGQYMQLMAHYYGSAEKIPKAALPDNVQTPPF